MAEEPEDERRVGVLVDKRLPVTVKRHGFLYADQTSVSSGSAISLPRCDNDFVAEITAKRNGELMRVKRHGELMRGLFGVLDAHQDGLPSTAAFAELEKAVPPTSFEAADYPNNPGVRRYEKIVRFASINQVKAGWLIKEKGQWSLTPDGREAYKKFIDPEDFQREAKRLYRAWKKAQPDTSAPEEDQPDTASTIEEAEEVAWKEIRGFLAQMPPYDFQALVAGLLKAMGYHVGWVAPPGPDRGIDIIAHTDPLGTNSPRMKVQVKRHADAKIAVDGLRAFLAVLGDQDVGVFISTAGFTSEAEREARSQEKRRITLIDANRLVELWIEHFDRLDDVERQRLPLKPVYYLAPRE